MKLKDFLESFKDTLKLRSKISIKDLKKLKPKPVIDKENYRARLKRLLSKVPIKISAVIPAYNEEKRIEYVLDTVCKYPFIHEMVVVNDGSTDNTAKIIKNFVKRCPKLIFVDLKKNKGKTGAVLEGIKRTTGDLIVMLDADLYDLKKEYLDKMLYLVASGQYDMVILDRMTDRLSPFGFLGIARLLGGERAFWKKDFLKIDLSNVKNYSLETAINLAYIKKDKKVRTVLAPELKAQWQLVKWNLPTAVKRYLKEFWEVYKASGIRNFYVQLTELEDETLGEIYSLFKKHKDKKVLKEVARAGVLVAVALGSIGLITYLATYQAKKKVKGLKKDIIRKSK